MPRTRQDGSERERDPTCKRLVLPLNSYCEHITEVGDREKDDPLCAETPFTSSPITPMLPKVARGRGEGWRSILPQQSCPEPEECAGTRRENPRTELLSGSPTPPAQLRLSRVWSPITGSGKAYPVLPGQAQLGVSVDNHRHILTAAHSST